MYCELGEAKLLGVDRVVEGEFEIGDDKDATVRAEADGTDVEVGDALAEFLRIFYYLFFDYVDATSLIKNER